MFHQRTHPVIVGGGPAGAVAALRMAQRGVPPLVVERQREPQDVICGEFLSAEAVAQLAALGVDVPSLGGVPIDCAEVMAGRRRATARLPFVAHSIRRRDLDAALLDAAAAHGAAVERGVKVLRLIDDGAETSEGAVRGSAVLLAVGKHPLSGQPPREVAVSPSSPDAFVGFKQYLRATPALARALARTVQVVVYDGGYAGVQLVAPDTINLCFVVSRSMLAEAGGRWEGICRRLVREPALAPLFDAEPLLPKPLTISGVPYGFLAAPREADRVYRLGDQAAVIPSFCGDGMAIAIHSGVLAADAVSAGASAAAYQRRLLADTRRPVRLAMRVQQMAQQPAGRMALVTGLAFVPGVLRMLARVTRMPSPGAAPTP